MDVVYTVEVVYFVGGGGIDPEPSPTGQTVVYKAIVSVVTEPSLAGQSVTVAAHDVMVYTDVVYTVDVVDKTAAGVEDTAGVEEVTPPGVEVSVTGVVVVVLLLVLFR